MNPKEFYFFFYVGKYPYQLLYVCVYINEIFKFRFSVVQSSFRGFSTLFYIVVYAYMTYINAVRSKSAVRNIYAGLGVIFCFFPFVFFGNK